MPRKKSYRQVNMTKARAARHIAEDNDFDLNHTPEPSEDIPHQSEADEMLEMLEEENAWDGGIYVLDESEDEFVPPGLVGDSSDEESLVEFEGEELEQNLQNLSDRYAQVEPDKPTVYELICNNSVTKREWKKAEANRSLGYTGNSTRTRERGRQKARELQKFREHAKTS